MTKIEWTEQTWNPIVGCSVVSPGCTNCYAMKMANRLSKNPATPQYHGTIQQSRGGPVWNGKVALAKQALLAPLKRKKPTMYFVNSMSDLFHENVPDEWIDRVFAVMALCPQHTFQVLTKRADRMRGYLGRIDISSDWSNYAPTLTNDPCAASIVEDIKFPLPNVWLGVSAEDQTRADERIPHLLGTPAAIRFVSCEPLLGPVDLLPYLFIYTHSDDAALNCGCHDAPLPFNDPATTSTEAISSPRLDWVITGGESGPNARPMHPDWARGLGDQCQDAEVPFFFKQWGEWAPGENVPHEVTGLCKDATWWENGWDFDQTRMHSPEDKWYCPADLYRIGKKRAGSLLDGREWKEMP